MANYVKHYTTIGLKLCKLGNVTESEYATAGNYTFLFSKSMNLIAGKKHISLLSATVGLGVGILIFIILNN